MKQFIVQNKHVFHVKTIGSKLFLAVMSGAVVGLGSTAILYYQKLKNQWEVQIRDTLSTEVNAIESQLTPIEQSLKNLGGVVQQLKETGVKDPDAYQRLALDFFLKRPLLVMGQSLQQSPYGIFSDRKWYASYYYIDQKVPGQIGRRLPAPNASVLFSDLVQEDNAPNQAYFKDTLAARHDTWLEPYDWYNISMTTANHLLWNRQGQLEGFVSMDVNVTQLSATIKSSVLHNTGHFVVITQRGTLVSYPLDSTKIRQSYRHIPVLVKIWPLLQQNSTGFFQASGHYWAYQRIPSTQWLMLAVVPESVVFWPVLGITLSGTLSAAIVIAAVIICFIHKLNHRLKPVLDECYRLEAEDAQRSIRLGQTIQENQDHRINPKLTFQNADELEILQQVFWRVTAQLKASFDELEWRVEERTAELCQMNEKLAQSNVEIVRSNRLKDEFLANMSHELRTPLNAILGISEGLQENVYGSLNEKQTKAIATIERSGRHLLTLINDILDLAKIESGNLELHYSRVAVSSLCTTSLSFVKEMALKKNIRLKTEIADNLDYIQMDELRMHQILINLLSNAVKFTPEGGTVTLAVGPDPSQQWLNFRVMDTGVGIAPEDISKLFQPFVQVDSSLNRRYEGTGLGLALVQRIATLHGGCVTVESAVGKGSQFTVQIPWQPQSLHPDPSSTAGDPSLSTDPQIDLHNPSISVLLVEDNEANLETFSEYLISYGYRLRVARNGQLAIQAIAQETPHIILMDIQMPEMDGLTAIRTIRTQADLSNIPIIALTALGMSEDREACLAAGANAYFSKPLSLRQLAETMETLLAETAEQIGSASGRSH